MVIIICLEHMYNWSITLRAVCGLSTLHHTSLSLLCLIKLEPNTNNKTKGNCTAAIWTALRRFHFHLSSIPPSAAFNYTRRNTDLKQTSGGNTAFCLTQTQFHQCWGHMGPNRAGVSEVGEILRLFTPIKAKQSHFYSKTNPFKGEYGWKMFKFTVLLASEKKHVW